MITILEVNSELGAGTRGASLGFESLQIASLSSERSIFKHPHQVKVETENNLLLSPSTTPGARYVQGISRTYDRLCAALGDVMGGNHFPFIIAGDHSMAGGTIAGIKIANPDKRLGVIWIDAHADLHSPFTSPSGNVHGMPLATALGMDNMENADLSLTITEQAKEGWAHLKNIGGICPKIKPEDLVFIGVRDTEEEEDALCEKYGIPNITVDEFRQMGFEGVAQKALDKLAACDMIYVSFDVDSLDTSISVGTGTPVPHGLYVEEAQSLIHTLLTDPKVCAFEVVEVNPLLDSHNQMARAVYPIIEDAFYTVLNRLH
ncbi:MAG: arginase [Flavobacteriales bacterium]|nr:arginase [Flavobacteriales bacterium]